MLSWKGEEDREVRREWREWKKGGSSNRREGRRRSSVESAWWRRKDGQKQRGRRTRRRRWHGRDSWMTSGGRETKYATEGWREEEGGGTTGGIDGRKKTAEGV
jgi:hypothetical protein